MKATLHPAASRLSAEEYAGLPEVPGFKDELIQGERVLAPMPKFSHTVVLDKVEMLLRNQFPELRIVREAGWRFRSDDGTESVPGPDLMVMRPEDYTRTAQSDGYFEGQPLFVVEIVSPSERRSRRMQKVGLYLEAGAGAVIEIDSPKRCAFVYRAEEDTPAIVRDRITSPFTADLSDL